MTPDIEPMLTMLSVAISASSSGAKQHAFLVYADEALAAVLAHPDHSVAEVFGTAWVLQAGFGPCSGPGRRVWHDLGEFHRWVIDRYRRAERDLEPDGQWRGA
jgi:hypothetical protein